MLKTMKPYLIKTVYRYGIQVHEFERFIRDAHDQSEINVISEMISILRDFPWRRDSENHIFNDDLIIKKLYNIWILYNLRLFQV